MTVSRTPAPNVLFIDNFDSFGFNLVDELRKRGATVHVWRNDVAADEALAMALALPEPRLILLSPGPGSPRDAGCCLELIRLAAGRVPIFGVCLGHQAMVEAFGGEVGYAGETVHGKTAAIDHDGAGVFAGIPSPMTVGRYHSLAARRMPDALRTTARLIPARAREDGLGDIVMALEHREHRLAGVQFHPESILTTGGGQLIENVMSWCAS